MRKALLAITAVASIVAATIAGPTKANAGCHGCWVGGAVAAGFIGGAILANRAYGYGYPGYYGYYGYPTYSYYGYAPSYYYAPYGYYYPRYRYAYYGGGYYPRYYGGYYGNGYYGRRVYAAGYYGRRYAYRRAHW